MPRKRHRGLFLNSEEVEFTPYWREREMRDSISLFSSAPAKLAMSACLSDFSRAGVSGFPPAEQHP